MSAKTPSPASAANVRRQANEYHQAAAVERRRSNHHAADLYLALAAELEALPAQQPRPPTQKDGS